MSPLLSVSGLVKRYGRETRAALAGVDFAIHAGRSFGIVGESGSGKSTLARIVMALTAPSAGEVRLLGRSLFALSARELRAARADFQMVFQDPQGSLDPRMKVGRIVGETLWRLPAEERAARVRSVLQSVGLGAEAEGRYPHEFSGGQRQRVAIARALASRPKLVVADEPVSALDVSIQAQVLNLLGDLQREEGVTYLFISHDLAVVGHLCAEIAVMFAGRFVEMGPAGLVLEAPKHPYTQELLAASQGEASPGSPYPDARTGCAYAARCPLAGATCLAAAPELRDLGGGRRTACWAI